MTSRGPSKRSMRPFLFNKKKGFDRNITTIYLVPNRKLKLSLQTTFLVFPTGASLVDQYPITLVHIVGFKIIKN